MPTLTYRRPASYEVRLPQFSGPLDLLLRLIEKDELAITELSLAQVADEYLSLVRSAEGRPDAGDMSSFLVVAAKLLLIKSQQLLPRPPAVILPVPDEDDVAAELVRSLQEYRRFKELAVELRQREHLHSYARVPSPSPSLKGKGDKPTGNGLHGVTLNELARLARRRTQLAMSLQVDAGAGRPSPLQPHRVTVNGRLKEIERGLAGGPVSYRGLLANQPAPTRSGRVQEAVVTFLAVLEVQRRKIARVEQNELFGDITMMRGVDDATDPDHAND